MRAIEKAQMRALEKLVLRGMELPPGPDRFTQEGWEFANPKVPKRGWWHLRRAEVVPQDFVAGDVVVHQLLSPTLKLVVIEPGKLHTCLCFNPKMGMAVRYRAAFLSFAEEDQDETPL